MLKTLTSDDKNLCLYGAIWQPKAGGSLGKICAVIGHTKAALYMHTAIVFLIQIIYKL